MASYVQLGAREFQLPNMSGKAEESGIPFAGGN
jgi:hypothetical protein